MAGHTATHTIGVPAFGPLAFRPSVTPMCERERQTHLHRRKGRTHAVPPMGAPLAVNRLQASIRIIERHGLCIGVVSLAGELSMHTVSRTRADLKTFMQEQDLSGYIFDLTHAKEIDSAGIALLIELTQWCRQRQAVYACTGPSKTARNLLELTSVSSILHVQASMNQAFAAFSAN